LPEDKSLKGFLKDEVKGKRSQDLPKYYRLNGSIYIANRALLVDCKDFFKIDNAYAFVMSHEDSVDIDTQNDLNYSVFLMRCNFE
jgi:N-acylneuraminate cytidylyltransferase/CMP-N,N'-diacetyllegionaminic acid synthase